MNLQNFLIKYPKKYIIFDLDETLTTLLIDWSNFRKKLWSLVAKLDKKLIKQVPNKSGTANILYNKTIIKHGEKARKILLKYCENYERNNYSGIVRNRNLINFIKKNHHKYKFSIWTSNNKKTVMPIIKKLKIGLFIKQVITKEDVNLLKPYPDGFYLIFNPKNQQRKDYLMVGDSDKDKFAAKAAGIDFLCIKNKHSEK